MDKLNIYQYCALRNEEDEPLQEKMNEPESYPILCQTQKESFLIPCAGATTPDATTGVQVCCSFFLSLTIPQATPQTSEAFKPVVRSPHPQSHICTLYSLYSCRDNYYILLLCIHGILPHLSCNTDLIALFSLTMLPPSVVFLESRHCVCIYVYTYTPAS